jgi:hypothetical protein
MTMTIMITRVTEKYYTIYIYTLCTTRTWVRAKYGTEKINVVLLKFILFD